MRYLCTLFSALFLIACNEQQEKSPAQKIVDRTIENAGGENYEEARIEFQFREMHYSSARNNGQFELTRTFTDSLGEVRDVLTNEGFVRFRNASKEEIGDSLETVYSNSVNSVHYFVQLPYGLNDPAVQKQLTGEDEIDGEPYYEIHVTFREEGGGTDHEDEYMYWIHREDYTVDYLAYRFYVNDGGIRFRRAYNPRTLEGIRFVDYENYKLEENWREIPLNRVDEMYEAGDLPLLSVIETEVEEVEIMEE